MKDRVYLKSINSWLFNGRNLMQPKSWLRIQFTIVIATMMV